MKDAFEKLFRAVHQFKKLNVSDLVPGLSSSEFSVMGAILQMGENGKITSSELAAKTNAGLWLLCDVTVKGRGYRSAG